MEKNIDKAWELLRELSHANNTGNSEEFVRLATENLELWDEQLFSVIVFGIELTETWVKENIEFCKLVIKTAEERGYRLTNLRDAMRYELLKQFVNEE